MIKRISILIFCSLLVPAVCLAAFTISLKNGGRIITRYYWQEGDQIKCYYADGVLGIGRDQVADIQKSSAAGPTRSAVTILTKEEKETVPAEEAPAPPGEDATAGEGKGAEQEEREVAKKKELSPEDVAHYQKLKADLEAERKDAQEKLEEALAAGDRNTKKAMMKKLQRLTAEQGNISLEIKAKTDGEFPDWWQPPRE